VTNNPNPATNGTTDHSTNGTPNGSTNGGAYADARSVAGLARDIEALRQALDKLQIDKLPGLPARLDELAGLVAQLADAVNASTASAGGVASWLDLPAEVDAAYSMLGELLTWMQVVYLRYPDAAAGLPDCWLWHPDVIEELLWLMQAWLAAYRDDKAPVSLAGDWHDRYRPGVVRRITTSAGRCSLENHQPREGQPLPCGGPVVPVAGAVEQIVTWWAHAAPTRRPSLTSGTWPPPTPDVAPGPGDERPTSAPR
jgi:hypothetical protein